MLDRRTLLLSSSLLLASGCMMAGRNQASIMTNPEFASIEKRIGGRLGAALVNWEGSLITSHRGTERFAMCSTFKAPLASALFAAHEAGRVDMHAQFTLKKEDAVPYMPFVEQRLKDGKPVTLYELARAAIITSDNAAANLVLEAIGGPSGFTDFVRTQGDAVTRLDRMEPDLNENALGDPRDTSTPIAMARLMQSLAIEGAVNDENGLTLQKWLKESVTGGARIRSGLPAGWPVGDKTGTAPGGSAYNDVAIIWPSASNPEIKPVILAVYTDRPKASAKRVDAAIADVAKAAMRLIAQ
ncbi:class A beta-lactamase [Parasphingorhabdus sp. JC815]|uniref:class A beta-lactamase n=1 Tax=Parasphingorhabdus sp. JC815 TaxID=3232140 RepID=UPI003459C3BE